MNITPISDNRTRLRLVLVALLLTLLVMFSLMIIFPLWDRFFAWLIAVNVVAFLTMGYDKVTASARGTLMPDWILLALTALGGALGAVVGMVLFRHKVQKTSFQMVFWPCVLISVVLVALYYFAVCPQCR